MAKGSKIICFANAKGGVGKTRASLAISDCLIGTHKRSVLLIDLDQQASASLFMLEGDVAFLRRLVEQGKTVDRYFELVAFEEEATSLTEFVVPRARRFYDTGAIIPQFGSLIPCSQRIDVIESSIISFAKNEKLVSARRAPVWHEYSHIIGELKSKLKEDIAAICMQAAYDFTIIDTAAGFHLFALIAMLIADVVIVPVVPDLMSLNATIQFLTQVKQYEIEAVQPLPATHLLFTKVQTGFHGHADTMDRLSNQQRGRVLQVPFLQKDIISQLDTSRNPLQSFDEKYGIAAGNVRAMAAEILSLPTLK